MLLSLSTGMLRVSPFMPPPTSSPMRGSMVLRAARTFASAASLAWRITSSAGRLLVAASTEACRSSGQEGAASRESLAFSVCSGGRSSSLAMALAAIACAERAALRPL